MNTKTLEALDTLDSSISLINLLRTISVEMIAEVGGEAGLQEILELVADKLHTARVLLSQERAKL